MVINKNLSLEIGDKADLFFVNSIVNIERVNDIGNETDYKITVTKRAFPYLKQRTAVGESMEEIKKEVIKQEKEFYKIICPYCEKEIKGTSESQAKYLLFQHKLSKHKDKIKIEEMKNGKI